MGYRIVYGQKERKFRGRWLLTAAFFMLFFVSVYYLWPEAASLLHQLLVPQPVETLVQRILEGDSIAEAVAAFGQELSDAS